MQPVDLTRGEPEFWEDYLGDVPVCQALVQNYPQLKDEILRYLRERNPLVDYPKYKVYHQETFEVTNLYDNYWGVIPLSVFKGEIFEHELPEFKDVSAFFDTLLRNARENCPVVNSIVSGPEADGVLANSFVSRLLPGTVIHPHKGWTNDWLRIHLGLVCDPLCTIKVGNATRVWEEGKLLAFKDGGQYPHSVAHHGTSERIVMSVDLNLKYLRTIIPQI